MNEYVEGSNIDMENKLAEISEMIRRENDPEKRSILLVLQCLTSTLSTLTRVLEEIDQKHTIEMSGHEKKIEEHEVLVIQGKTTLKVFSVIFSAVNTCIVGIWIYGYVLIADLRDTVRDQAILIPRIEASIEKIKTDINQQNTTN